VSGRAEFKLALREAENTLPHSVWLRAIALGLDVLIDTLVPACDCPPGAKFHANNCPEFPGIERRQEKFR
jgi:hypothetical protein